MPKQAAFPFGRDPAAAGALREALIALAAEAAAAVMAARTPGMGYRIKPDGSPVTAADAAAQAVLLAGLNRLLPDLPVVAEEGCPPRLSSGAAFALIDPLDGTREFLGGRDDFTINIALIAEGRAVVGIIAAPALGLVWRGERGAGAERLQLARGCAAPAAAVPIRTRMRPATGLTALVSRSHRDAATEALLDRLAVRSRTAMGSALKFARLAEGAADLYPRLAPTHEWDVAAGHALLAAAGGEVTDVAGAPLTYGHAERGFVVPAFIAWGDPAAAVARTGD